MKEGLMITIILFGLIEIYHKRKSYKKIFKKPYMRVVK